MSKAAAAAAGALVSRSFEELACGDGVVNFSRGSVVRVLYLYLPAMEVDNTKRAVHRKTSRILRESVVRMRTPACLVS